MADQNNEPSPLYPMMRVLMAEEPLPPEEFAEIVARHGEFIASGGGGGYWETFVTSDSERGLVLGIYRGQRKKETDGAQAELQHKRLEGLDLRGIELPYANLCGVACQEQDLTGIDLEGSLLTDSDFSGSTFRQANLVQADFSRSIMCRCDFREADLTDTDFENCDLTGADFRGARMDGTRFPGAKLDEALW